MACLCEITEIRQTKKSLQRVKKAYNKVKLKKFIYARIPFMKIAKSAANRENWFMTHIY